MPSVFIKTYGCQMNERDSEAVAAQLVAKGYAMTPDELSLIHISEPTRPY